MLHHPSQPHSTVIGHAVGYGTLTIVNLTLNCAEYPPAAPDASLLPQGMMLLPLSAASSWHNSVQDQVAAALHLGKTVSGGHQTLRGHQWDWEEGKVFD